MARVALATSGAIIGGAIGGPVGAAIGQMAGTLIGNVLFPGPDTLVEGPRLQDLIVQSSASGAPIFQVYGTARLAGNVIWTDGITEIAIDEDIGGKGGADATSRTYRYRVDLAIGICEGPIDELIQIYADNKLIFDRDVSQLSSPSTNAEEIAFWNTTKSDLRFRLYKGTATQEPDSVMEASEGAGEVPAYRGLAYIVFDNLWLEDFGNRIPLFQFVVTTNASTANALTVAGTASVSTLLAVNEEERWAIWATSTGLVVYDLATMELKRSNTWALAMPTKTPPASSAYPAYFDGQGYVYAWSGSNNHGHLTKISTKTLTETVVWGDSGLDVFNTTTGFTAPQQVVGHSTKYMPALIVDDGGAEEPAAVRSYILSLGQFGTLGILETTGDTQLEYIWGSGKEVGNAAQGPGICRGANAVGSCDFFIVAGAGGATGIRFSHLRVNGGLENVAELVYQFAITVTDIHAAGGNPSFLSQPWWDKDEDAILFAATFSTSHYLVKIDTAGSVLWAIDTDAFGDANNYNMMNAYSTPIMGEIVLYTEDGSDTLAIVDTSNGNLVTSYTSLDIHTAAGDGHWIGSNEALFEVAGSGSDGLRRIMANRVQGQGETLSTIVSDVCSKVDLEAADIDVTELTDTVPGYVVTRQMSAAQALRPLMMAYDFDGVEIDHKLEFPKRGKSSSVSLVESDLLQAKKKGSGALQTKRGQEFELPEKVSLTYTNRDTAFQQDMQQDRRQLAPVRAMQSRNTMALQIPVIETATKMKQLAQSILYRAWLERDTYTFGLSQEFLGIDPADVVTLTMDDGRAFILRVGKITAGADLKLMVEAVAEDSTVYSSTVTADDGDGYTRQAVTLPGNAKTILVDAPLLRDSEDPVTAVPVHHFSMGPFFEGAWPGGALFRSIDGQIYNALMSAGSAMTWGYTSTALGDIPSNEFNAVDYTNTVNVDIQAGSANLATVTYDQLMAASNAAAILKANGEVEYIGFQTVTQVSGSTYTLSNLLRGQRGSNTMATGHAKNDLFILLTEATVRAFAVAATDVSAERWYRGVGRGEIIENVTPISLTSAGRSLMPYSVTEQIATRSGNDVVFTWVRRTRVGGALLDATGTIPLSEDSEAYEIDILDDAGVVIATKTGIIAETYTYADADIITDFGLGTTAHAPTMVDLGFEGGADNGLISTYGLWTSAQNMRYRNIVARSGSLSLAPNNEHQDSWAYQRFELSALAAGDGLLLKVDAGAVTYSWDGYIYGDGSFTGNLRARFLDAALAEISLDTSPGVTNNNAWALDTVSGTIPALTRYIQFECFADYNSTSSADWCYFDDLNQPTITSPNWDGGDLITLDAEIVQISATVDRGFSTARTFTII